MPRSRPLLEFSDVTVIKGERKILDSLTITIREGENVAILGPNGAGKSTFIKTITREYYPAFRPGGYVFRIWGQEQWNIFELRFLLGIVSNDLQDACSRDITGMEMVLSGFFGSIGLYKERVTSRMRGKARQVIEFLEVSPLRHRKMNEMSSGEARRFLIGRALVHDPKVLILDEPTNTLDPHALYKFTGILRKIARSGIGIILVTQNLHDIIPEIGRVVLMKQGRICRDGEKERILTSRTISRFFGSPVSLMKKNGYYYALRG